MIVLEGLERKHSASRRITEFVYARPQVVWLAVCVTLGIWIAAAQTGWDAAVYQRAIRSLALHRDPYMDGIAIQEACHATHCLERGGQVPFSYVYSPITLPILRLAGFLPPALVGVLYWLLYAAAVIAQLWVCGQAALENERAHLRVLAPVAIFFPGLLASGIVVSGNVAFLVYAAVLLAAYRGWRRSSWSWFYVVVIAASCFKAPWLGLVLIPLLSARKQVVASVTTVLSGVALFAVQPLLWPELFRHYLRAVSLMFEYNRDFGCGPAGLFSDLLYRHGLSYSTDGAVFYLACAVPVLGVLFYLSRRYLEGYFSFEEWMPVLLVGVLLVNPRLIEYDVAPLSLLMLMILWRFLGQHYSRKKATILFAVSFLGLNGLSLESWEIHKFVDGPLLVLCFGLGVARLFMQLPAWSTLFGAPLAENADIFVLTESFDEVGS